MTFTTALVAFAVISLIYLMIEVFYTYHTFGTGYGWSSNRKTEKELPDLGKRIKNTLQNQVESATYIVPVLTVAIATGLEHSGAEIAALLIVIGRAAFGPLYYTGVPFIRIPAWGLGWISTAYIAVILLSQ